MQQSLCFAATFEGNFKEVRDQSTTIKEVDRVVTTRRFQMLLQWLYNGRVVLGEFPSSEAITAILEFVKLVDVCGISDIESPMAEHITKLILANDFDRARELSDVLTCCFQIQHVASAAALPKGHLVRNTLAAATVKEYFQFQDRRFVGKAEEYPDFSVDSELHALPSIRGKTDPTKAIYLVAAFHQLHCLSQLRSQTIHLFNDPEFSIQLETYYHTMYCADILRQLIICQADSTLIHRRHRVKDEFPGDGALRTCRNFGALADWTRRHSYVSPPDQELVTDLLF